jgi:photosystem II stability/assembly factor-like uncharacterized protein
MSGHVRLNDIYFIDELNGWAVGRLQENVWSNILVSTNNGGSTWIKYNQANAGTGLNAVYFTGLSDGWAVGNGGVVLKTADGGSKWENVDIGTTCDLQDVKFKDSSKGWIIGGKNSYYGWEAIILHTDDGGATWNTQLYDTNLLLVKGSFPDQENGWVVGSKKNYGGIVLQTLDGGATWHEQTTGTHYSLYSVFFIDSQEGWIGGSGGSILHTTNGGVSGYKPIPGSIKDTKSMIQISPNPFTRQTTLEFTLQQSGQVHLAIYNQMGEKVAVLADEYKPVGEYKISWNAAGLPAGMYYCRLQAGTQIYSGKMILIK